MPNPLDDKRRAGSLGRALTLAALIGVALLPGLAGAAGPAADDGIAWHAPEAPAPKVKRWFKVVPSAQARPLRFPSARGQHPGAIPEPILPGAAAGEDGLVPAGEAPAPRRLFTLSDALKDAGWREETTRKLRTLGDSEFRF